MIEVVKEFWESSAKEDWWTDEYMSHFAKARIIKIDIVSRLFWELTLSMVNLLEGEKSGNYIKRQDLTEHPTVKFFNELTDLLILRPVGAGELRDQIPDCPDEARDYFLIDDFWDGKKIISVFTFMLSFTERKDPKSKMYYTAEDLTLETVHFHLWALLIYYSFPYDVVPAQMDLVMDIALAQLSLRALLFMEGADVLATDRIRLQKAHAGKSDKIQERHQEVRKFYNQIDPYARKPYAIAKLIHQEMSKKMQEVPTVRTIRDDLRKLGLC